MDNKINTSEVIASMRNYLVQTFGESIAKDYDLLHEEQDAIILRSSGYKSSWCSAIAFAGISLIDYAFRTFGLYAYITTIQLDADREYPIIRFHS